LALGLFVASKQYCFFLLPFAFFLLPRPVTWRAYVRLVLPALGVATILTLPFFLWSPRAFFDAVVLFQVRQPFRPDSLSFLAWFVRGEGTSPGGWIAFAALLPALGLAAVRGARTPAGFAAIGAFLFMVFFATSKQAFCNYYYFTIGTICAAAA